MNREFDGEFGTKAVGLSCRGGFSGGDDMKRTSVDGDASSSSMFFSFGALILAVVLLVAYMTEFQPGMAPDTYRSIVSPMHPAVAEVPSPLADEGGIPHAGLDLRAPSGRAVAAEGGASGQR